MTERTRAAELERQRHMLAEFDHLMNPRLEPPFRHPLAPQVSTFALERRVVALEAVVAQLLELPVVRHSAVVTATLDGE